MTGPQRCRAVIAAPFGALELVASGSHLIDVEIKTEMRDMIPPATPVLLEAARQLNAYFEAPDWRFSLPLFVAGTPFQQIVWQAMCAIPAGSVKTYGQLAAELHSGPRAVAGACRANHFPIIIPCHRVVSVKGIGGYGGAVSGAVLNIKRQLLQHEGYEFP